jgi:hypothetical protein
MTLPFWIIGVVADSIIPKREGSLFFIQINLETLDE